MKFQLVFIALASIALTCESFTKFCPKSSGFFPNPADCSEFLHCMHGTPRVLKCPAGYHFSSGDVICEVPEKAKCPNICKSRYGDLIPHPTNCGQFYQCDNGRAVVKNCPPTTHFNSKLQVCDFVYRAGCIAKSN